jgi:hypothetical protein
MKDKQIDLSDIPVLGQSFFKRAVPWPQRPVGAATGIEGVIDHLKS